MFFFFFLIFKPNCSYTTLVLHVLCVQSIGKETESAGFPNNIYNKADRLVRASFVCDMFGEGPFSPCRVFLFLNKIRRYSNVFFLIKDERQKNIYSKA